MVADLVQNGLSSWWAPALAFVAGVVSFASPCVFPLVPGYVSFVGGGRAIDRNERPLLPILLFILGFSIVFTLLGAAGTEVFRALRSTTAQRIGGAIVIAFGLVMLLYALGRGPAALFAERRPLLERAHPGTVGALPLGMAFAAGWTPCIGPVLGGILALAASSGSSARGALLLFVYSMGLGLPFLLVGLGVQRLMGAVGWIRRNYRAIAGVSGLLLIVVGVLILTGAFTRLLAPLARYAPGL
jgi:cytochrome c-type biogenesis protein